MIANSLVGRVSRPDAVAVPRSSAALLWHGLPAHALLASLCMAALLCASFASAGVIFEDDFETLDERWIKNVRATRRRDCGWWRGGQVPEDDLRGRASLPHHRARSEALRWHDDRGHGDGEARGLRRRPADLLDAQVPYRRALPEAESHKNHAARWLGSFDWTEKKLSAQLDERQERIVLDLGIQNGTGTAYYDNLVVKDTFGQGRPVSLLSVANLGRSDGVAGDGKGSFLDLGLNDLFSLMGGNLETDTVTFYLPKHGANGGQTCVILKGEQRPSSPGRRSPFRWRRRWGASRSCTPRRGPTWARKSRA